MGTVREGHQLFNEYVQWATKRQQTDHNYQILFRGVSSAEYNLQPGGWRKNVTHFGAADEKMRELLIDHLYLWAEDAASINPEIRKLQILELMALAQHYGLPTFLLDWTTNPLVALLFSTLSINDADFTAPITKTGCTDYKHDYVIYSFAPEGEVVHTNETLQASNGMEINNTPLLYRPPIFDNRIKAQSGVFTYHHSSNLDIRVKYADSILSKNTKYEFKILDSFSFNAYEALKLRKILISLNINNFMIMPDLEGLSAHYKNTLKQQRYGYPAPKTSPGENYLDKLKSVKSLNKPLP